MFFAKAACNATDEDIKAVFSQFGHVCEVSLFRPSLGASISKGCGLVVMSSPAEARIALESLQGRYIWPGVDSPMVVTWMDVELQRRRREHHMASMRHILTTGPGNATGAHFGSRYMHTYTDTDVSSGCSLKPSHAWTMHISHAPERMQCHSFCGSDGVTRNDRVLTYVAASHQMPCSAAQPAVFAC